jgi:hypothetical protein
MKLKFKRINIFLLRGQNLLGNSIFPVQLNFAGFC